MWKVAVVFVLNHLEREKWRGFDNVELPDQEFKSLYIGGL